MVISRNAGGKASFTCPTACACRNAAIFLAKDSFLSLMPVACCSNEYQAISFIMRGLLCAKSKTSDAYPQQGGGKIIAISSYGGQAIHPGALLYHASKWGLEGFFESLAKEVASFGISVNIVGPGSARTAFRSTAGEQMGALPDAYKDTPLGQMLGRLNDNGYTAKGAPEKMACMILKRVETESAPLHLIPGSDAYALWNVH